MLFIRSVLVFSLTIGVTLAHAQFSASQKQRIAKSAEHVLDRLRYFDDARRPTEQELSQYAAGRYWYDITKMKRPQVQVAELSEICQRELGMTFHAYQSTFWASLKGNKVQFAPAGDGPPHHVRITSVTKRSDGLVSALGTVTTDESSDGTTKVGVWGRFVGDRFVPNAVFNPERPPAPPQRKLPTYLATPIILPEAQQKVIEKSLRTIRGVLDDFDELHRPSDSKLCVYAVFRYLYDLKNQDATHTTIDVLRAICKQDLGLTFRRFVPGWHTSLQGGIVLFSQDPNENDDIGWAQGLQIERAAKLTDGRLVLIGVQNEEQEAGRFKFGVRGRMIGDRFVPAAAKRLRSEAECAAWLGKKP